MLKKTRIRIWIVVMITCVMCFSDWSFAADDASNIWSIAWTLDFITSVLSWLWIVFANLAWKFLTNNWVYGQALWIDILLRQYRNIVKNMANFCLWFYLMYVIFRWLIWQNKGKGDILKNLKGVLLWTLIAWIWIQASWFLTSVTIDLSTITLTAVGAFPSQILSKSEDVKEWMDVTMREFNEGGMEVNQQMILDLFPKDGAANSFTRTTKIPLKKPLSNTGLADSLMPNKDDVSGPLYYMGICILNAKALNSVADESRPLSEKTILNLIIQWWTTIVYAIEMAVLCIIALMRVLYLRMFIVLSPLAILLACLQKAWEKDLLWKWFVSNLMKQINLKTFLAKVFQPAIIIFWISLTMIFVTLISKIVNEDKTKSMENFDIWWATITTMKDPKTSSSDDVTYTTRLEWGLLKLSMSTVWKGFLDFMMSIITVVLVYFIINLSIKVWNKLWGWQDFLSKKIEGIQKSVSWVMTSLPVMPVAWYDKEWVPKTQYLSAGRVFWLWGKQGLIWSKIDQYQKKVNEKYDEQSSLIRSWFWDKTSYLSADEVQKIQSVWSTSHWLDILIAKKDVIVKEMRTDVWKWMTLNPEIASNDGLWIKQFTGWLNGVDTSNLPSDWLKMVQAWRKNPDKDKRSLQALFEDPNEWKKYIRTYVEFFFDENDSRRKINNWRDLRNADISKTDSKTDDDSEAESQ